MRGQRIVARLVVVALVLGMLASVPLAGAAAPASASARQEEPIEIAFSVVGLNFPFFVHMMGRAREAAAELGIELIPLDGQDDSAKQSADLEAMITRGVDGVVISPKDVEALAPAVQAVVDAGIPVVTVDRTVRGVETLAHVGADNVRGGELQGEYLIEILPEGGQIIELRGTPGASPAIDRDAGLKQALEGHPEIEIVFDQTADFARDQAVTVTEQALQANPDIDAIVAANDDMALGAAEAAAGFGIDVPIIGFDALPEALQAIQDGTMAATIEQFPGRQASEALQIIVEFIENGTEPAEHDNFIEPALITADNLGEAERAAEAGITPAGTPEATPAAARLD